MSLEECAGSTACSSTTTTPLNLNDESESAITQQEDPSDEKPFACDRCDFRAKFRYLVLQHVKYRHERSKFSFKCDQCDTFWPNRMALRNHQKNHTIQEKPYSCEMCDFRTNREQCLLAHQLVHTHERPYPCDRCDYRAKTEANLKKHISITHEKLKLKYKCGVCGVAFLHESSLKTHRLEHANDQLFACEHCDFRAKQKNQMAAHVGMKHREQNSNFLNVSADMTFSCDVCGELFCNKPKLMYHRRKHVDTKSRPYGCDHCDVRFFERSKQQKHIATVHTVKKKRFGGSARFCCQVEGCGQVFHNSASFLTHRMIAHRLAVEQRATDNVITDNVVADTVTADNAAVDVTPAIQLIKQEPAETAATEESEGEEPMESQLMEQLTATSEQYFRCSICKESFASKRLLVYHGRQHVNVNDRPYGCDLCDARFFVLADRQRHFEMVHTAKKHQAKGQFVCKVDGCGKMFSIGACYLNHRILAHGLVVKQRSIDDGCLNGSPVEQESSELRGTTKKTTEPHSDSMKKKLDEEHEVNCEQPGGIEVEIKSEPIFDF